MMWGLLVFFIMMGGWRVAPAANDARPWQNMEALDRCWEENQKRPEY